MCKVGRSLCGRLGGEWVGLIRLAHTVLLITALSFLVCPFLFVYLFIFTVSGRSTVHDPHTVLVFIGTSLSEPHTSMTALRTRVCIWLWPTTYRKFQMSAFKYFTKISISCVKHVKASGGHQNAVSETWNKDD